MNKLWSMGVSGFIAYPLYGILKDMGVSSSDSFYITILIWLNFTTLNILVNYFGKYIIKD